MTTFLLACSGHTVVDSLLFGGPILGVIGWIKFDSWRRRNDPEPELEELPRMQG